MPNTRYVNATTSFSGADLVVTFGNRVIGELQQISWGIQREKAPVYTLGSADARSFARGKRGIGGSMIFAQFSRDAILEEMRYQWEDVALPASFVSAGDIVNVHSEDFTNALNLTAWDATTTDSGDMGNFTGFEATASEIDAANAGDEDGASKQDTKVSMKTSLPSYLKASNGQLAVNDGSGSGNDPYTEDPQGNEDMINVPHGFETLGRDNIVYVDMLPPFDITMTFANEYGNTAFQRIYDVDILNDASGLSVDSMVMERQMSYIARRMSPLIEGVFSRDGSGDITAYSQYGAGGAGGTSASPMKTPKVNTFENRKYTWD